MVNFTENTLNSLLHDKRNLSFTYNTDGVPLFESSKFFLWPLHFAVNELPCPQRFQRENMILAGLWYDERKPLMLNFLKPFHTDLSNLERDRVEAKSPSGECSISKAILLFGKYWKASIPFFFFMEQLF